MSQGVIMILDGSLGEQLFQYAAGRALTSTLGGKLYLSEADGVDYRSTLFVDGFPPPPFKATNVYRQIASREPWNPERFRGMDTLYCKGKFQYLPALQPVIPFIKKELLESLYSIRQQLIKKYNLHMRKRATFVYVTKEKSQETYESAIANLNTIKSIHIYILSNDPVWCKSQSWLRQYTFVDESEIHGLAFMSLCEGGGIGEDPLSWWGALLSAV
jgi:hypothetical protein